MLSGSLGYSALMRIILAFWGDSVKLSASSRAGVAQLVEQLICNQQVAGSSPIASSRNIRGEVPERPKGTDCKSVGDAFGGSNPPLSTTFLV